MKTTLILGKVSRSWPGILLLGGLLFNLLAALFLLGGRFHSEERMTIYGFVAILGVIACLAILYFIPTFPGKRQALILILVVLLAVGASLLFHDDYFGGECFFNIHLGYPFGWRESGTTCDFAMQSQISANTLFFNYPAGMTWRIDPAALVGDCLFWLNAALLAVLLWILARRVFSNRLG